LQNKIFGCYRWQAVENARFWSKATY